MNHKTIIYRIAVIDSTEFSKERIAAFQSLTKHLHSPIIFTDQILPNPEFVDEFMDSPEFQETAKLKAWLEENGFNAFSIAQVNFASGLTHINELIKEEEV